MLAPLRGDVRKPLRVFVFHFPAGLDNSGFVGWLASHLKATLGTGVLVVCGYNRARDGVFDYWGVPAAVGDAALAEVERLRAFGRGRVEAVAGDAERRPPAGASS